MTIDTKDAVRYLQMEDAVTDAVLSRRIAQLCGLAAGTIRPSYTWKRFPISEHGISSGGLTLQMSRTLTTHLRGCRAAYLMCGTLGAGFDAFMRRVSVTSGADALIVQAIGNAIPALSLSVVACIAPILFNISLAYSLSKLNTRDAHQ